MTDPTRHRFVFNVVGYCCSGCRWTQKSGTPAEAEANHRREHYPPVMPGSEAS